MDPAFSSPFSLSLSQSGEEFDMRGGRVRDRGEWWFVVAFVPSLQFTLLPLLFENLFLEESR